MLFLQARTQSRSSPALMVKEQPGAKGCTQRALTDAGRGSWWWPSSPSLLMSVKALLASCPTTPPAPKAAHKARAWPTLLSSWSREDILATINNNQVYEPFIIPELDPILADSNGSDLISRFCWRLEHRTPWLTSVIGISPFTDGIILTGGKAIYSPHLVHSTACPRQPGAKAESIQGRTA